MTSSVSQPPATLDGARVLMFTAIDTRHAVTGATHHLVGGQPLSGVAGLAIAQYDGETSVYLFYCSAEWHVLTDTLHDSTAEALSQAEFEFAGSVSTWLPINRR